MAVSMFRSSRPPKPVQRKPQATAACKVPSCRLSLLWTFTAATRKTTNRIVPTMGKAVSTLYMGTLKPSSLTRAWT